MKKFYSVCAAAIMAICLSAPADAATRDDLANLSVLWDKVEITNGGYRAKVTAAIRTKDGTVFNAPVFARIHSNLVSSYVMGESSHDAMYLPQNGNHTSDVRDWSMKTYLIPAGTTQVFASLNYEDENGNTIEIARVPVNRRGTTGVNDLVAEAAQARVTRVYTIDGILVAEGSDIDLNDLQPGMYIVRTGDTVRKVVH